MKSRKINTASPQDRQAFIRFPYQIYRNIPQWVPHLDSELHMAMNRSEHPFYQHSKADFFVVESEGQVLGRVQVIHNHNYCQHHQKQIAFVYYFECVDDPQVSQMLLDTAAGWARRHNLTSILGPKGMLRSAGHGLLQQGFEDDPAMGIPYNPQYYNTLFEKYGFVKETDYFSGYLDTSTALPDKLFEVAEKVKQRGNFWVKGFSSLAEMKKWIPELDGVHEQAFRAKANYYPSTPAEFAFMAKTMLQVMTPNLVKLIMKGDQIAGFILTYPDVSQALKRIKGKLFPFGWADVLMEQKRTRLLNINGLGILPEYQGLGANALLYAELDRTIRSANRFDRAEIVQVDERNFLSKSDMERMGVVWNKTHRSYVLQLAE